MYTSVTQEVKTASVRDFRARLAELIEGTDPVLVTRHGKHVAVVYPLRNPSKVPAEVRRRIVSSFARTFGLDDEASSEWIERYKQDVDRTLIRENLRRTPEERLRALQALQEFAGNVRAAK